MKDCVWFLLEPVQDNAAAALVEVWVWDADLYGEGDSDDAGSEGGAHHGGSEGGKDEACAKDGGERLPLLHHRHPSQVGVVSVVLPQVLWVL